MNTQLPPNSTLSGLVIQHSHDLDVSTAFLDLHPPIKEALEDDALILQFRESR